ncbi:Phosphoribosylaminoimidazole-succinocarboxamide synthase [Streptomyces alboniger]
MTGMGVEAGAQAARHRALAVLRIRSRALAVALLPAAVAVVLLAGGVTDHLVGPVWDGARWTMTVAAVIVLLAAAGVALVVSRARPAVSPTVPIAEETAPDLYRMVRDLADRLDVPAPSAIALTPDCDSWLEDRTHPAHGPPPLEDQDEIAGAHGAPRRSAAAPVLVIGSPFLWWMRVGELRAVLAPVVAGTGPSAHPDIAAARRFVRGLDAAVAVTSAPRRDPVTRTVLAGVGWVVRLLLRSCRGHAGEMERGVAAAAAERAQAVDYGLRIVAQEQVGLAYAGWDRLLTKVALPAWRMGRWPSRLDAGVVAALTELSRRDRLAEGFASRLGERPACDLLEEPGTVDEAASLLAARLFHGGPPESGADWSPVDWQEYPEEVVDRKWRTDAARLDRVLDTLGVRRSPDPASLAPAAPTLARIINHLAEPASPTGGPPIESLGSTSLNGHTDGEGDTSPGDDSSSEPPRDHEPAAEPVRPPHDDPADTDRQDDPHDPSQALSRDPSLAVSHELPRSSERGADLAARLSAEVAREEASAAPRADGDWAAAGQGSPDTALWDDMLPLFPLQPPRTGRELLADHALSGPLRRAGLRVRDVRLGTFTGPAGPCRYPGPARHREPHRPHLQTRLTARPPVPLSGTDPSYGRIDPVGPPRRPPPPGSGPTGAPFSSTTRHLQLVEKPEPIQVPGLVHLHTGKVRELYQNEAGDLVMVTSDRLSAFDWVLPTEIPDKGRVLTQLSLWWFDQMADQSQPRPEHRPAPRRPCRLGRPHADLQVAPDGPGGVRGPRLSHRLGPGRVQRVPHGLGLALPEGLSDGSELPAPIFTPATKAAVGEHDENISWRSPVRSAPRQPPSCARPPSLSTRAAGTSPRTAGSSSRTPVRVRLRGGDPGPRGRDPHPGLLRFWPADQWQPGRAQPSYDKQYVRDWLTSPAVRLGPQERAAAAAAARRRSWTRHAPSTWRRTSA